MARRPRPAELRGVVTFWAAVGHFFGLDNGSGPNYLWWSGIGSDISEVAIVGGLIALYRRHVCHLDGCHRIARHTVGPYAVCTRHHPDHSAGQKITPAHIARAARRTRTPT